MQSEVSLKIYSEKTLRHMGKSILYIGIPLLGLKAEYINIWQNKLEKVVLVLYMSRY